MLNGIKWFKIKFEYFIDQSELNAVDGVNGTEYVEIHRPADSTDSGLGSDSANTSKVWLILHF